MYIDEGHFVFFIPLYGCWECHIFTSEPLCTNGLGHFFSQQPKKKGSHTFRKSSTVCHFRLHLAARTQTTQRDNRLKSQLQVGGTDQFPTVVPWWEAERLCVDWKIILLILNVRITVLRNRYSCGCHLVATMLVHRPPTTLASFQVPDDVAKPAKSNLRLLSNSLVSLNCPDLVEITLSGRCSCRCCSERATFVISQFNLQIFVIVVSVVVSGDIGYLVLILEGPPRTEPEPVLMTDRFCNRASSSMEAPRRLG